MAETKDAGQWVNVRLLFVRGNAGDTQATVGRHDWAAFLTTDTALSPVGILELYAIVGLFDAHRECWFLQVLQLDVKTLRLEALEINDEQAMQVKTNSETLVITSNQCHSRSI